MLGRAEKDARFLVHLTDIKSSLAAVSYTVSLAELTMDIGDEPTPTSLTE